MKFNALLAALSVLAVAACASDEPVADNMPPPPPTATAPTPPPQAIRAIPGSVQDFQESAGDRVFFDYDAFTLRADARGTLDRQAAWLNQYSAVSVQIHGNADERGTREYNLALAARRANSVRDYLVSAGVAASRIETISNGEEAPVCSASTEDCWALNRNGTTVIVSGAAIS